MILGNLPGHNLKVNKNFTTHTDPKLLGISFFKKCLMEELIF